MFRSPGIFDKDNLFETIKPNYMNRIVVFNIKEANYCFSKIIIDSVIALRGDGTYGICSNMEQIEEFYKPK